MKTTIYTDKAPAPIGSYSQAVLADKTLYLSGQIALDAKSMQIVSPELSQQTKKVFENLQEVLSEAKMSFDNIVKLNVYMLDLNDFGTVNEIMAEFISQPFPARAVIEVSRLPKDALIEIDGIAC